MFRNHELVRRCRIPGLSPALSLLLLVTVGLSVLALWWPEQDDGNRAMNARSRNRAVDAVVPLPGSEASAALPVGISSEGQRVIGDEVPVRRLGPPSADPFALQPSASALAVPTVVNAVPVNATSEVAQAPATQANPPASQHVLFGRFREPGGAWRVFVTDPGASGGAVAAVAGVVLSTGWTIRSVGAQEIRLVWPETGVQASIPMPADPEESTGQ